MEKLDIEDLFGEHENGRPKDPIEELLTKINEIIDWINLNVNVEPWFIRYCLRVIPIQL